MMTITHRRGETELCLLEPDAGGPTYTAKATRSQSCFLARPDSRISMPWYLRTRRRYILLGFACSAATVVGAHDLIRGLPRSKQTLYGQGIACVPRDRSAGAAVTVHVPIERINDNYCDCEDGSDEPGTASACENARFYCMNAGHKGMYIPSSHVDDGACDCCDGSDEPLGACPDICAPEGEASRKAAMEKAELILKGVAARTEMYLEGKRLVREDSKKLETARKEVASLAAKIASAEKRVQVLKIIRDDVERLPTGNLNSDSDENSDVELDLSDHAKAEAGNLYPNMDEKPFDGEGISDGDAPDIPEEVHIENSGKNTPDSASLPDDAAAETGNGSQLDLAASVASEEALCAELASTGKKNRVVAAVEYYRALGLAKLRKAIPAKLRPSFGTFGNVPEAGACLAKAEEAVRLLRTERSDLGRDISGLESKVVDELRADPALRALYGKCVRGTFTQYDFELCVFEQVQQYEHGSVIARLGSWGSWNPDAARPHSVMTYDGGDQCWNGPKRSVTVTLECGPVNEIVSVDEPNRCAYHMLFKTPAVCEESAANAVRMAATASEREANDEL